MKKKQLKVLNIEKYNNFNRVSFCTSRVTAKNSRRKLYFYFYFYRKNSVRSNFPFIIFYYLVR